MLFKPTYIAVVLMIFLSSYTTVPSSEMAIDITLLTTETEFQAGNDIVLVFETSETIQPMLYCTNSYGSTLVNPISEAQKVSYQLPKDMTKKVGQVHWKLLYDHRSISGQFSIISQPEVALIETYIGPPSIQAGGTDYTMLVVIPTDHLDNPLVEHTIVNAKHQFLTTEANDTIRTKHLIAYKNIYSEKKSGRMLVSSESRNTNSKEFTINVLPAIPTGFSISAQRPHDYADGNQLTTFKTSVLKDKLNNTISDGTFVTFYITNHKANVLTTIGTTIDGVATAYMIHPDHETQWRVKAYVTGMAESSAILLNYKQVITDFDVKFSKNNRDLTIGPLQSFMDQFIPDGLKVEVFVYKNDTLMDVQSKTSVAGYVHFNLKQDILQNDTYNIIIKTGGLEQSFKAKTLW